MIYMFLADGFEETEALVTLDMLRRAGFNVKTVGIDSDELTGTHGIIVKSDIQTDKLCFSEMEAIILPGGMPGTENLFSSKDVNAAVDYCIEKGLAVAAICAAPVILGRRGLLQGKKAVCYPGFERELVGADVSGGLCITDGNIITAKGAGCVFEFSHAIITLLSEKKTADRVIAEIQHKGI